jgi:hypothetical protein
MRKPASLFIVAIAVALLSGATTAATPSGKARTNRIHVEYDPPKNPAHQMLYDKIKERRLLESLQQIFSPFRLPTELTIKTLGCDGLRDSWYDTDNSIPTVHVCYELLQDILDTAPKETTPAGITPIDAVYGQFLFWVSHEVGHAVFDIFQVPIFGREEDAADQFAGYILLHFGKDQARRMIGGAAYGFVSLVKEYKQDPELRKRLEKYSSVHGFPEQRFYNLVCLAYGADPTQFADVVEKGYLPKSRADDCDYEFQTFSKAWQREIKPHIDLKMAKTVLDTEWLPQSSTQPIRK